MRQTLLCLMVIALLMTFAACRVTEEEFCPTGAGTAAAGTAAPDVSEPAAGELSSSVPSAQADEASLAEAYDIELYHNGENREGYSLMEDPEKRIVETAIFNYMVKSAAWPGVEVETLDLYIHIAGWDADGGVQEYYVFDRDGAHCMQAGKDGMYSTISDEVYQPLYALAMGWHTPHTMTILSGEESIFAVRNWVSSQSADGLCADGMRLTPQQAAAEVEYITYAEDFAPYIDGEVRPGLLLRLYNEDFAEVEYPVAPPDWQPGHTLAGPAQADISPWRSRALRKKTAAAAATSIFSGWSCRRKMGPGGGQAGVD